VIDVRCVERQLGETHESESLRGLRHDTLLTLSTQSVGTDKTLTRGSE